MRTLRAAKCGGKRLVKICGKVRAPENSRCESSAPVVENGDEIGIVFARPRSSLRLFRRCEPKAKQFSFLNRVWIATPLRGSR
jgi:hypothetical protein